MEKIDEIQYKLDNMCLEQYTDIKILCNDMVQWLNLYEDILLIKEKEKYSYMNNVKKNSEEFQVVQYKDDLYILIIMNDGGHQCCYPLFNYFLVDYNKNKNGIIDTLYLDFIEVYEGHNKHNKLINQNNNIVKKTNEFNNEFCYYINELLKNNGTREYNNIFEEFENVIYKKIIPMILDFRNDGYSNIDIKLDENYEIFNKNKLSILCYVFNNYYNQLKNKEYDKELCKNFLNYINQIVLNNDLDNLMYCDDDDMVDRKKQNIYLHFNKQYYDINLNECLNNKKREFIYFSYN